MSQSGYTPIQLYRTTTASAAPSAGNLAAGELAINLTDEKLYFKNASGVVKLLASNSGSLGSVTSVDASGGTTGLTFSGGPITSSGTLTLAGTLAVGNGGTGTATAFTAGSIVFAGASGVYTQDNANLFWDDTNNRLGIGTATPASKLDVVGQDAIRITGFQPFQTWRDSNDANKGFRIQTAGGATLFSNDSTGGGTYTERMRIDGSGNVGIGTSSPGAKLNVVDASVNDALRITQTGTGNALVVEDSANPDSTPFVIFADGRSVQGHTSTFNFSGASYLSEALGSGTYYPFAAGYTGASATGPRLALVKNRSANWSTNTTVQSGDQLGDISFTGSDGTDFVRGAAITASVDGTPGTNDMPGRLAFATTAAGSFSPTERMRIDSSGNIGFNSTSLGGGSGTYRFAGNVTGATTSAGILYTPTVSSDVTGVASVFVSQPSTQAAAFTLGDLRHFLANQGTIGATSSVTNQYGFYANSSLTGATNNYGFYGAIASGAGRYNLYMAGTADNYLAGNLGINATPQAWGANYKGIEGYGASTFFLSGNSVNGITTVGNSYQNGTNWVYTTTGAAARYQVGITTAPHIWSYAASGTAGATVTWSEAMRIDSSGNVGIGTSSPGAKLQVTDSSNSVTPLIVDSGSGADTTRGIAMNVSGSNYGRILVPSASGGAMAFWTGGAGAASERVRITSAGDVGIGTASPAVKVHALTPSATSVAFRAGNSVSYAELQVDASGNSVLIAPGGTQIFNTNGAERMRIDSNGNVGIGTSSPASKFDVNGGMAQNAVAVAASAIDCSLGNVFSKTAAGALTWTITNAPASRAFTIILELTNGGTGAQTWPASVKWPSGTAPTLTTSGVDVLGFITDDGGTVWRGVLLMKDSK